MAESDDKLLAKVTAASVKHGAEPPASATKKTLDIFFGEYKPKFAELLQGSGMPVDKFVRVLITKVGTSKKLLEIAINNPASILGACMEIAQWGLDLSIPNEAFLIPYGPKCQAQLGYKGMMKLASEAARQAGIPFKTFRSDIIHANDSYYRTYGDSPRVTLDPPPFGTEPGEMIGFVAVAKDKSGLTNFREMTVAEVREHQKKFCKSLNNSDSPWYGGRNFDSYGLKTVLRRLISKDLPMGPKLAAALEMEDQAEAEMVALPESRQLNGAASGDIDMSTLSIDGSETETSLET